MKFRVADTHVESSISYLEKTGIPYKYTPFKSNSTTQTAIFQIQEPFSTSESENNSYTTNNTHRIAQALLQQFNYEKNHERNTSLNIGIKQWLKSYQQKLSSLNTTDKAQIQNRSMEKQLLSENLRALRAKIRIQHKQLLQQLQSYKTTEQQYKDSADIENKKIRLCTENIDLRIKNRENSGDQVSAEQQLTRIKSVLKNGVWGYLPNIEEKLLKIKNLQEQ